MQAVEQISVTLPADMVARLRARVSAGEYLNESEAMELALRAAEKLDAEIDAALPELDETEVEHRVRMELVTAYDAYKRDPTDVLTLEEVRASLEQSRRARAAA